METEIKSAESIPSHLNAGKFIEARFKEISELNNLLNESNRVTSIFQRLPKQMRRRAMSHTVKRVPRNLRNAHKRQLEKNKAIKKEKRPRKYFRRRSKTLLVDYNRRQKEVLWLESHVWHAKRFHMVKKWGYKLADRSCDKTFKASYRAISSHCLVQDISYYCCLEMSGYTETLTNGFQQLTSTKCGLSIGAKCWLAGTREGSILLYHRNSYPYRVIGNVSFMWKPQHPNESTRTLWLWCHPAYHQEIVQELVQVFALCEVPQPDIEMEEPSVSQKAENVERTKIALKNVPSSKIPRYVNLSSCTNLLLLKDTLNRFRLTGPLSNAVLVNALHSAHDQPMDEESSVVALQLLDKYSQPSCFPPHAILGDRIIDPRLFLKRPRRKAVPNYGDSSQCPTLPLAASSTAIWDANIRDDAVGSKLSNVKINELRKNLIPGQDSQLVNVVNTRIPIMLVQRPGSCQDNVRLGYGSGWDLIIPASWSISVWLPLILSGAKPGALRESRTLNFESKIMPELYPDSKAGSKHYEEIRISEEERYFKLPPNKRNNYIKNGFPTPFHYPWLLLTAEWSTTTDSEQFYVLRDKAHLSKLRDHLQNIRRGTGQRSTADAEAVFATYLTHRCLIPVSIVVSCKGTLTPFSQVCVPNAYDLETRLRNKRFLGPTEKCHCDANKTRRTVLRREHVKELKRLRRKRARGKKDQKKKLPPPRKLSKRKESPTEQMVREYLRSMRNLWVPRNVTKMRNHCDREVSGFVVNSGFSFGESCVLGQGYVTVQSFSVLCALWTRFRCDPVVLTRSPNTLNYRFGGLNINF